MTENSYSLRWALQSAARELLPGERVAGCLRWLQGGRKTVDILHSAEVQKAHFKGLQTCGSVWADPVCASKITERRRVELTGALAANPQYRVALVTLTLRHAAGDRLDAVLDPMLAAYRFIKSGRRWKEFVGDVGLVGSIRALEVTLGKNGWHPHLHLLTFQDGGQPADLEGFLTERWLAAIERQGREALAGPGCDVRTANADVAAYIAKYGTQPIDTTFRWTLEHELAKGPAKRGKDGGGETPTQLLANYLVGHKESGWRWQEYAHTFKGKRQLQWSRGLRDLLGLDKELTDKELAEQQEKDSVLLAALSLSQWRAVLGNDCRGELLEVASSGDAVKVYQFLDSLGIGTDKAVVESHLDTNADFAEQYHARADRKFIREPGQAVSVDLPPEPVKPFGRRGPVPGRQREIAGEKCGVVRAFALADLGGGQ